MTTPFWINEPRILLDGDNIFKIWPTLIMSKNEKLNSISRLIILLTILGYFTTKQFKILVTGIITLAVIILIQKIQKKKVSISSTEAFTSSNYYDIIKDEYSKPTPINPTMNVLLTDIADNPNRKAAAPTFNPIVAEDINTATKEFITSKFNDPNIDEKLFKDLGDNFAFDQSMRTWYATPNTQVPSDQKKFMEFCYGDMKSNKEQS
jgi:hypothetical protein